MKKNFDELFAMYNNCDEEIWEALEECDFDELYRECGKRLAETYNFRLFLEDQEQYYYKEA